MLMVSASGYWEGHHMLEISNVDRAWEAMNILGESVQKALAAIENMGGKRPSKSPIDIRQLHAYSFESIATVISKAIKPTKTALTFPILVDIYKQTDRYKKLKYKVRVHRDEELEKVIKVAGDLTLSSLVAEDFENWYSHWTSGGKHLPMGISMITIVRLLLGVGLTKLNDPDCARLSLALRLTRFTISYIKRKQINAAQAIAIRGRAHEMGLHSLALAVAIQFELELGQKEMIGEWLPESEPGPAEVIDGDLKWAGPMWSHIDRERCLSIKLGDKTFRVDLNRAPMVKEELDRIGKLPTSGPLIGREGTERPYSAPDYRRMWRIIAQKVGVPADVYNIQRQGRAGRNIRAALLVSDATQNMKAVRDACRLAPAEVREAVMQEMAKDIVAGVLALSDLEKRRSEYVRRQYKAEGNRFSVSLDQPHSLRTQRLINEATGVS
jgi:hypothetical protein